MWLDTWDVHKPLGRAAQAGEDLGTHSAGKGTARRAREGLGLSAGICPTTLSGPGRSPKGLVKRSGVL